VVSSIAHRVAKPEAVDVLVDLLMTDVLVDPLTCWCVLLLIEMSQLYRLNGTVLMCVDDCVLMIVVFRVVKPRGDAKERSRYLSETYGWENREGRKIWSFGSPGDSECNVLVDLTKGVVPVSVITFVSPPANDPSKFAPTVRTSQPTNREQPT
jgi:hypothetical protein